MHFDERVNKVFAKEFEDHISKKRKSLTAQLTVKILIL